MSKKKQRPKLRILISILVILIGLILLILDFSSRFGMSPDVGSSRALPAAESPQSDGEGRTEITVPLSALLVAGGLLLSGLALLLLWLRGAPREGDRGSLQTGEELILSLERLNRAERIGKMGYWHRDLQSGEIWWSENEYRLHDYPPTVTPTYALHQRRVHPEDRRTHEAHSQSFFNSGAKEGETEYRMLLDDGAIRHIHSRYYTVCDEEGNPMRSYGIDQDVTDRKESELRLRATLEEREALLRELYHRTRNSMQLIASMISLKRGVCAEPAVCRILQEIEVKIQSISLVHQRLYESGRLSRIRLDEYLAELAALVFSSFDGIAERVGLSLELEPMETVIDIAVPLGLVLNELLLNALRHGFPGERSGTVSLGLRGAGSRGVLECRDDGVGLPPEIDIFKTDSLGMLTIRSLAEGQLGGSVEIERSGGTCLRISFCRSNFKARV